MIGSLWNAVVHIQVVLAAALPPATRAAAWPLTIALTLGFFRGLVLVVGFFMGICSAFWVYFLRPRKNLKKMGQWAGTWLVLQGRVRPAIR